MQLVPLRRGAALANQHRFRDAAEDFERALEIDPSDENAKKYLVGLYKLNPVDP
jgi:tetratricopeptide (TPR) repeat protein